MQDMCHLISSSVTNSADLLSAKIKRKNSVSFSVVHWKSRTIESSCFFVNIMINQSRNTFNYGRPWFLGSLTNYPKFSRYWISCDLSMEMKALNRKQLSLRPRILTFSNKKVITLFQKLCLLFWNVAIMKLKY